MKILIVDDEPPAREAIVRSLVKLGFNKILEAKNGADAFELTLAERPDLVFADIRMPVVDGIEFLRKVSEQMLNTLIVFISGYNQFDYAQNALRLGAFDYLLKPVSESDLANLIKNAEKSIQLQSTKRETDSLMKIKVVQGMEFMKRHFIYDLVSQKQLSENYINERTSELEISFPGDCFCVVLQSIDSLSQDISSIAIKDMELLRFSMENISKELLNRADIASYFFDTADGFGCLLNFNSNVIITGNERLLDIYTDIRNMIKSFLHYNVTIGIGLVTNNRGDLQNSYETAHNAISQRLARGGDKVFCFNVFKKNMDSRNVIDLKTEQDLLQSFEMRDYTSILGTIERLYSFFKAADVVDVANLNKHNLQLVLLFFKALEQAGINPENILGDEFTLYNEVNSCHSIDAMINWFETKLGICLEAILSTRENGNRKLLHKALEYINRNIVLDITLEMATEHVHISQTYLSRLFRQELGETFLNYVTKERINKAKVLLKEGMYKANEVSTLVGFNDEKHFYKVFKKTTGLTPGEYKKM